MCVGCEVVMKSRRQLVLQSVLAKPQYIGDSEVDFDSLSAPPFPAAFAKYHVGVLYRPTMLLWPIICGNLAKIDERLPCVRYIETMSSHPRAIQDSQRKSWDAICV